MIMMMMMICLLLTFSDSRVEVTPVTYPPYHHHHLHLLDVNSELFSAKAGDRTAVVLARYPSLML